MLHLGITEQRRLRTSSPRHAGSSVLTYDCLKTPYDTSIYRWSLHSVPTAECKHWYRLSMMMYNSLSCGKGEKVKTEDTCYSACTSSQKRSIWHAFSRDYTVLPGTHAFIHESNEPYPPLLFQPKLVLIYRPRRDGRLSRMFSYRCGA